MLFEEEGEVRGWKDEVMVMVWDQEVKRRRSGVSGRAAQGSRA